MLVMKKKLIKVEHDGAFNEEWTESFGNSNSGIPRTKSTNTKRKLGESVTTEDLLSVVFSLTAEFDVANKEVVVVPRSRGGFVYAAVTEKVITDKCSFDSEITHPSIRYRVTYPGGIKGGNSSKSSRSQSQQQQQQQQLTKYLPPFFIGKLPSKVLPETVKAADEMDKVTKGLTSMEIDRLSRKIGERVLKCDLLNACFSPVSTFEAGQIVAVPRSFGGFTYGRVLEQHKTRCFMSKTTTHEIDGWRVVMKERSAENGHMNYKDLPVAVIGRLFFTGNVKKPVNLTIERPQKQVLPGEVEEAEVEEEEENVVDVTKAPVSTAAVTAATAAMDDGFDEEDEEDEFFNFIMKNDRSNKLINGENDDDDESDGYGEKSKSKTKSVSLSPPPTSSQQQQQQQQQQQKTMSGGGRASPTKGMGLINVSKQTYAKATEPKDDIGRVLVVIDAPNVARHEDKMVLKVRLLKSAIDYYTRKGCDVVAFLPKYFMDKRTPSENNPTVETYAEMEALVKNGTVSLTPPQDYDDSYCIEYAKKHKGVIVTNDMYRDHIEKHRSEDSNVLRWIKTHCISYTFVRGEFIPNPDFKWDKV